MQSSLQLIIREREKVLFEGEVQSITSINEKGVFDVLSMHANFISTIQENCLIHNTDGSRKEITLKTGVISVAEDKVSIYLGIED